MGPKFVGKPQGLSPAFAGVRVVDVVLDGGACVRLLGKGHKQRSVPLWSTTVVKIRAWQRLNPTLRGEAASLPNRDGRAMSRSNVAQRLDLAVTRAAHRYSPLTFPLSHPSVFP